MKVGVVQFLGSNCDADCYYVFNDILHIPTSYIWHTETDLSEFDCIILPGGFSYGDYLRPGALASQSPVIGSLKEFAAAGKSILGICNGFQILTETGLLPGALIRNTSTTFICKDVDLVVNNASTVFTTRYDNGNILAMPVAHNEGNYYASEEVIDQLHHNNQVVFKYKTDVNGSCDNIAGIVNEQGNVLGMMPHPERCADRTLGSLSGLGVFQSIVENLL